MIELNRIQLTKWSVLLLLGFRMERISCSALPAACFLYRFNATGSHVAIRIHTISFFHANWMGCYQLECVLCFVITFFHISPLLSLALCVIFGFATVLSHLEMAENHLIFLWKWLPDSKGSEINHFAKIASHEIIRIWIFFSSVNVLCTSMTSIDQ